MKNYLENEVNETRRWHVMISCQPDGCPPQPVRPWKSGRIHLAEGSNVVVLEQEIRSVELRCLFNATFSFFDHVMKIGWFFAEIWRCIDFQNGGRPPFWNCFTTIRDHSRSPCCWPQLPVKFHVNLIHRSEDIHVAVWIFRIFGLKCLFRSQKLRFLGDFWPIIETPKGTSLRKSASFKLSTVKIRWGVWPVGELRESVKDTHTDRQTHTHR